MLVRGSKPSAPISDGLPKCRCINCRVHEGADAILAFETRALTRLLLCYKYGRAETSNWATADLL